MRFVMERCERGRGRRPRWASQGLEFLMLACDPYNTKHLSDEEFEELKQLMDACISHVIGSRPAPLGPPQAPSSATLHTEPSRRVRRALHSPLSNSNGAQSPLYKEGAAPVTPPTECNAPSSQPEEVPGHNGSSAEGWNSETSDYSRRVAEAVRRLDEARDETLRSKRAVGRVLQSAVASYEPKLRQVTFKWQRGLKIGAGTFGKVYTVVNTESGQLLAMKELSVCAGDRRALRRAANELRVLEGVLHPHLVRYYGCELHRVRCTHIALYCTRAAPAPRAVLRLRAAPRALHTHCTLLHTCCNPHLVRYYGCELHRVRCTHIVHCCTRAASAPRAVLRLRAAPRALHTHWRSTAHVLHPHLVR
ncbi:unnamed protein product [Parnassius apollo]|uniref:(apollo) hypothetical protein n=1 Tax=Parnassius apollo TaxID=110799 RepID=A0A8S3XSX3_PARAO|nr:unnamed protein product [Parnassius apollo]